MQKKLTSLVPAMRLAGIKADCGGKELRETGRRPGLAERIRTREKAYNILNG